MREAAPQLVLLRSEAEAVEALAQLVADAAVRKVKQQKTAAGDDAAATENEGSRSVSDSLRISKRN